MAKVLLISCNTAREPYPVYPLGMTMVAEAVRARGHSVMQWDLLHTEASPDQTTATISDFEPDVIGLSLRNIDNCDSAGLVSFAESVGDFVRTLRKCTDSPVVLGGAGYSLFPEVLLDRTGANYGIAGEGEATFCELVDDLVTGKPVQHRILRGQGYMPGEQINAHTRDSQLASFYLSEGGMLNLQTKRGCPLRCAYCTYPVLEGRVYRFRPTEAVVDEIEALVERYGAEYYAIADSVFNDLEGRYLAIAEELVRRGITTPWMAFFRPSRFVPDEVALLKRAGLHSVEWGTDGATDITLEGLRKGFTWDEVENSNRLFAEAGICNAHFVIFGGPGETEQTLAQGLANLERLSDCVVFAYCGIRILPGTAIHDLAIAEGQVTAEDDLLDARFYFSGDVTRELVHRAVLSSFGGRGDRIYPPGKDIEKIRAFHSMGHRGPIWDLLLANRSGGRRRRRRARTS
jgi:radical SAM superfamily enzyme YgiQ (UPF0313 family)